MRLTYLEATYRKGKPLAAYLHLPHEDGERSVRTERDTSCLIVDFGADDRAIGIEIPEPSRLVRADLNRLLERLGEEPVSEADLAPLTAA